MSNLLSNLEFYNIISEYHLAKSFTSQYKNLIRYCKETRTWFTYDGVRWQETIDFITLRHMLQITANEYFEEYLPRCTDDKQQVKLKKFINKVKRKGGSKSVFLDAEIFSDIHISKYDFDNHPTLLTVPNGTINLVTGELLENSKRNFITRMAAYHFQSQVKMPNIYKISFRNY